MQPGTIPDWAKVFPHFLLLRSPRDFFFPVYVRESGGLYVESFPKAKLSQWRGGRTMRAGAHPTSRILIGTALSLLSPRSLLYGDPWATCSRARSLLSLLLLSQCKLLSLPYTSDPFTPANSKLELIAIALSGQATLPLSLRTFIQKGDLSFSLLLLPWDDTNR